MNVKFCIPSSLSIVKHPDILSWHLSTIRSHFVKFGATLLLKFDIASLSWIIPGHNLCINRLSNSTFRQMLWHCWQRGHLPYQRLAVRIQSSGKFYNEHIYCRCQKDENEEKRGRKKPIFRQTDSIYVNFCHRHTFGSFCWLTITNCSASFVYFLSFHTSIWNDLAFW